MYLKTSVLTIVGICMTISAFAADAPDFNTFYSLYKTPSEQNDITVTGDLTALRLLSVAGGSTTIINGGGFDFNGSGLNGFTVSDGYTFSLENGGAFNNSDSVTISKSYHNFVSPQGAVIANLGGNVTVNNVAFAENSSTYGGGVMYQNNSGTINVSNSVFDSNQATRGDGGVLYNEYETTATFNNVVFQNNSARDNGGVAFNDGTLNISDSTFIGNSASSGAGLYNSNTMNLNRVKFVDNSGTSDAGAIYSTGQMNLSYGTFENNTGETGGAIGNYGIIGDTLYANISNSQFTGNSATYGGAIYNWDDIYVIDTIFENNKATDGGGAIFNLSELYLIADNTDVTFTGNTSGGISNAIHSTGTISMNALSDKSIIFNDAITGTGEIIINRPYIYNTQNVPTGGTIELNADMGGFSGDVTVYNGTVKLSDNGAKFFDADNLHMVGGTLDVGTANIAVSNAVFDSGSALQITVNNGDTYGSITANSFDISTGANLSVILSPSAMDDTKLLRVQLLRGDAPVNDTFTPTINNNIYMFTQAGNGWYEIAKQNDFYDVINGAGGTQNNIRTAAAWQNEPALPNSLEYDVYAKMDALLQTDALSYIQSLTALAPSPAPIIQILGTSYTSRFASLMSNDTSTRNYLANGKLWFSGFGGGGNLQGTTQYADFDMYGAGAAVGGEYTRNALTLGAVYMYQYDRIKSWARTIHAPTHGGGVYANYTPFNIEWRNAATVFYTDATETKNVAGIQIDNDPTFYTYGAWSDLGYRFSTINWDIKPFAGAKYTLIHRNESTDAVHQTMSDNNLHFLTAYGAVSVTRNNWAVGNIDLIPEIQIGASYDIRTESDEAYVSVNDTSYRIIGETLPRFALNTGLKLRAVFNPITELDVGINADLRQDYTNYNVHLRGVFRF